MTRPYLLIQAEATRIPLADESVHCVVTSPPYWGLRDYLVEGQVGDEPTPDAYVANMVKVFREVWRVLRDDGTCWVNLGDCCTAGKTRLNATCERGGMRWSGAQSYRRDRRPREDDPRKSVPGLAPKNIVGIPWRMAFALQGFAVVPFRSFSILANELKAARESQDWEAVQMIEGRLRLMDLTAALQANGWRLRKDIIWHKPNPMPESAGDRPGTAHEYLFLLAKRRRYSYDAEAVKVKSSRPDDRKPYAPGQIDARGDGHDRGGGKRTGRDPTTANLRSVWKISTQGYKGPHFATFPEKLVEPCVKAGTSEVGSCPHCGAPWARLVGKTRRATRPGENTKIKVPGGWDIAKGAHGTIHREGRTEATYRDQAEIGNRDRKRHVTVTTTIGFEKPCSCPYATPVPCLVFDPFVGSGTTCAVAARLGRRSIGVDLSLTYLLEHAKDRVGLAYRPSTHRTAKESDSPLFSGVFT